MKMIIRSVDDEVLERVVHDFGFLSDRIDKENGELDLRLRNNYFNLYYKGNSLAKVRVKTTPYPIEINKAFAMGAIDCSRFGQPKMSGDYCVYEVLPADLPAFLSKTVITRLYSKIKACDFSEELVFEQLLIADNRDRSDFVIIDRQVQGGALGRDRIDLLALRKTDAGSRFQFVVVEVKMGNNPELSGAVADQIQGYVKTITENFDEFKSCYERTYFQMKAIGLLKAVTFDSIQIETPVKGVIVVGGYPGLARKAESCLRREHPDLSIRSIDYKI